MVLYFSIDPPARPWLNDDVDDWIERLKVSVSYIYVVYDCLYRASGVFIFTNKQCLRDLFTIYFHIFERICETENISYVKS